MNYTLIINAHLVYRLGPRKRSTAVFNMSIKILTTFLCLMLNCRKGHIHAQTMFYSYFFHYLMVNLHSASKNPVITPFWQPDDTAPAFLNFSYCSFFITQKVHNYLYSRERGDGILPHGQNTGSSHIALYCLIK